MRIFLTFFTLCACASLQAQSLKINPDRPDARYSIGETVTFHVTATNSAPVIVDWELSNDGYVVHDQGRSEGTENFKITGSLEKPGFLKCKVTLSPKDKKPIVKFANVAIDPEKISASREVPDDFDDFWAAEKERLAATPVEFQLRRQALDEDSSGVELFDVQIETGPEIKNVSGYFSRPKNAKPKSLPAVLWVHGAGVRSSSKPTALNGAKRGFLSMDINAHGLPNDRPAEFYKSMATGELANYRTLGRENRDGVYFRGVYLRLVRAIDFLTAQPEWNGKVLGVIGHSQGGGQAIVAGGLDERVTFIGAGVPALCDHTGMLRKRISGWPKFVPILPDGKPDPVVAEVSRYYDAVNFASRCHAQTIFSVGYVDHTCPPTSVYAAYNQIQGEKEIIERPTMGHARPKDVEEAFFVALSEHAKK